MSDQLPARIGKYEVVSHLGAGGMGQVYLARDPQTGQQVAVKVLSTGLARESGFVDRFQREVLAMEKFSHPGIVRLIDSGIDEERPWFAMQYIEGETLLSMLRRERRVDWRRAVDLIGQICRALKAAHDHGVIHRDLKPSNLLVDRQGKLHLTDFGVAQLFDSERLTITGGVIGTAEYMSPEQAEGKRATKQSDLYSVGILLYVMITGRPPFQGKSTVDVLQKQRYGLYDKARSIVPELPLRVDDTINRLLEKDPQKRFPDAFVLLRHLEQLLQREQRAEQGLTIGGEESDPSSTAATAMVPAGSSDPTHVAHRTSHDRDDDDSDDDGDDADDSTTTAETGVISRGPRPPGSATLMKGLMRAELEQLNRQPPIVEFLTSGPMLDLMLAGLLWGMWRMWPREATEEELFARGQQLLQQGEGLNYLQARRECFEPLLKRNPERWTPAVEPMLNEIELYEISRRTQRKPRGNDNTTASNPSYDSEPSRLIHWATALRKEGNLARSRQILTSLRDVLASDPERPELLQLTERLLKELETDLGESAREFVRESLERVRNLHRDGKQPQAWMVLRSLFNLYQQDEACRILITGCRRELWPELPETRFESNHWPLDLSSPSDTDDSLRESDE
ncbi:MAG: serine/threonine protein kinase [Planctomycetaceae bacterium]